jgi:hypothetical protein
LRKQWILVEILGESAAYPHVGDQRQRPGLPYLLARIGWLAPDGFLDRVGLGDASKRLGCDR